MKPTAAKLFTQTRTFSQNEFDRFAALTGDDNPIHVDPIFAARTRFGRTVAHGMFLYASVCAFLGECFPGMIQLEQELIFPTPTFAGEPILFRLEVTQTEPESGRLRLQTTATSPRGEVGLQGQTVILLSKKYPPNTGDDLPPRPPAPQSEADTLRGLSIGQQASEIRTFSTADLSEYADLSGDVNPVYRARLPGALLGGMFSNLLGTRLPGRGTNWLKQSLRFPSPAAPDEAIQASAEIIRLRPDKDLVNLRTLCGGPRGVVCEGEALVLVKDLES